MSLSQSQAATRTRLILIGLIMLVFGVFLGASMVGLISQLNPKPSRAEAMQASAENVCRAAYEGSFLKNGLLTEEQFSGACEKEAQEMIATYPLAVERCYGQFPEEPYQMLECVTGKGAKFSGTYMLTARV